MGLRASQLRGALGDPDLSPPRDDAGVLASVNDKGLTAGADAPSLTDAARAGVHVVRAGRRMPPAGANKELGEPERARTARPLSGASGKMGA
jgi:hypothetical protein